MLRCADGSFYVGCTTDLDGRIAHHDAGKHGGYTATQRPVEVVWSEAFQSICDRRRAQDQGWSRAKKQALIAGDCATISRLASRAGR